MEEIIRIPEDRIGALIGPNGEVRRKIERFTKCKIEIDSETGDVEISGEGEEYFRAASVVKAIGRGFAPDRAYKLLEDDYTLRIIDIPEIVGKNTSSLKAKRGRVIGRHGLARQEIEKKTYSMISVQGKTVAIIARLIDIDNAIRATEMLLQGAKHETVDRFLEHETTEQFKL